MTPINLQLKPGFKKEKPNEDFFKTFYKCSTFDDIDPNKLKDIEKEFEIDHVKYNVYQISCLSQQTSTYRVRILLGKINLNKIDDLVELDLLRESLNDFYVCKEFLENDKKSFFENIMHRSIRHEDIKNTRLFMLDSLLFLYHFVNEK